jgi:hypothetical protein
MEATNKENSIAFIIKCMNSDLYSYKEFMDDMITKEGSIYNFLIKHDSSFNEWKDWFDGL